MKRKKGFTSLIVIVAIAVGWLAYTLTWGGKTPNLGLDLQGGTSVVLAPKVVEGQPSPSSDAIDQTINVIRRRVDGLGVAEPEITRQGDFIVVSLPGVKEQDQALRTVGRTARLTFRPACTVSIGGQTLQELPTGQPDELYQQALTAAVGGQCVVGPPATTATTAPGTVDTSGASTTPDTSSTTPATDTPAINSAGTSSSSGALGLPTAAGHLSATQTPSTAAGDSTTTAPGDTSTTAPGDTTPTTAATTTTTADPNKPCGLTGFNAPDQPDTAPIIATTDENHDGTIDGCAVLGPAGLDGTDVASAQAAIPQGTWVVELTFTDAGLAKFNVLVGHCYSRDQYCTAGTTAIVLDGHVESNPAPQEPTFTSNQIQISGPTGAPLTQQEAEDLALVLNYGSLPVELEQQRVEEISATLGQDSLRAGLIAGGDRHRPRRDLHDPLLPVARPGGGGRPRRVVGAQLLDHRVPVEQLRPRAQSGWCHRHRGLGGRHDRQLHRVLRAHEGRGEGRSQRALVGRPRVRTGMAHDRRRRLGVVHRRAAALLAHGRRRPRLRVLPRLVDDARPDHRLLLQAADGGAPREEQLLRQRTVVRHGRRAGRGA